MTNTLHSHTDRSTSTTHDERVGRGRRRTPFDLSATQLIATALAATTATFAASYLGVAGTVIGAAIASVVSTIGNAVYGHSLRSTRARVRGVVPRRPGHAPDRDADDDIGDHDIDDDDLDIDDGVPTLPSPTPGTPGERGWRRIAIAAIAVFVAVLAVVTGVEIVAGRPLSDIVRGDSGQGTSLFGESAGGATPAPTVTETVTPSVTVVTPIVTQTAPAVTRTATPTVTATPSAASGATTASPSAIPTTASTAPSQGASGTTTPNGKPNP